MPRERGARAKTRFPWQPFLTFLRCPSPAPSPSEEGPASCWGQPAQAGPLPHRQETRRWCGRPPSRGPAPTPVCLGQRCAWRGQEVTRLLLWETDSRALRSKSCEGLVRGRAGSFHLDRGSGVHPPPSDRVPKPLPPDCLDSRSGPSLVSWVAGGKWHRVPVLRDAETRAELVPRVSVVDSKRQQV